MITRRQLRNMRARWERDLAVLDAAFAGIDLAQASNPESETIRNLATAIGQIDGIITNRLPLNNRFDARVRMGNDGSC